MSIPQPIVNRHGRKGGRGVRPFLLLPKVVGVIVYAGGLSAVLGIWLASDFTSLDLSDPRRALILHQVSRVMVFLVVPALLLAIVFGVLLLLQHPREFLRMRWLQIKLLTLIILIPSAHFYSRYQFTQLKRTTDREISDATATRFTGGMIVALAGTLWVVAIGRIKPRAGQPYRAIAAASPPADAG